MITGYDLYVAVHERTSDDLWNAYAAFHPTYKLTEYSQIYVLSRLKRESDTMQMYVQDILLIPL